MEPVLSWQQPAAFCQSHKKNKLKTLKPIFIYSNVWVSFCAASLVLSTSLLTGNPPSFQAIFLVFFSTVFAYNFQRFGKIGKKNEKPDSPIHRWIRANRQHVVATMVVSALCAGICLWFLNPEILWLLVPAGLLSVNYTIGWMFGKKQVGLRDIPALKIFLIALVWTIATVALPLVHEEGILTLSENETLLLIAERFMFVVAITLPFDIRDLPYDEPEKKTLPQMLSDTGGKMLALLFLAGSAVLRFFHAGLYGCDMCNNHWIYGLLYLLIGSMIALARKNRKETYFSFWMEATSLFYTLAAGAWVFTS